MFAKNSLIEVTDDKMNQEIILSSIEGKLRGERKQIVNEDIYYVLEIRNNKKM